MQFVEDVTLFGLGYDGWTGHSEVSSVIRRAQIARWNPRRARNEHRSQYRGAVKAFQGRAREDAGHFVRRVRLRRIGRASGL
jgi:hypothetical protein